MGGDMNDVINNNKKKEIEISSTISLKESCEMRLQDQREYIDSLKRDKTILAVVVGVLVVFIVSLLVLDIVLGSHGWVRY
jgi:uncharacterized membrane protein